MIRILVTLLCLCALLGTAYAQEKSCEKVCAEKAMKEFKDKVVKGESPGRDIEARQAACEKECKASREKAAKDKPAPREKGSGNK